MKPKKTAFITDEDRQLFRAAVGEVKPVGGAEQDIRPSPPKPRRPRIFHDNEDFAQCLLSDGLDETDIEYGETLTYLRPGMQQSILRKLRRGQYSIGGSLDLHGMTVDEARVAISVFLAEQRLGPHRCVRIVHGKGNRSAHRGPVLKRMVNRWLPQRDDVLAFCSAPPHDGGTGAIYVLLKGKG
ncbi:MAG TPA: DNA mismatch repair protein MutS [Halothiobacillus sp.]|nr:DNA mismatch repair protein MutS [Halothiobacillus sp.]